MLQSAEARQLRELMAAIYPASAVLDGTAGALHRTGGLGEISIVEPIAGNSPGENIGNPVSRLYYSASAMVCVPTSLAKEVGEAQGARAGEKKLTEVLVGAGFGSVRRAAEGPFYMMLEAHL